MKLFLSHAVATRQLQVHTESMASKRYLFPLYNVKKTGFHQNDFLWQQTNSSMSFVLVSNISRSQLDKNCLNVYFGGHPSYLYNFLVWICKSKIHREMDFKNINYHLNIVRSFIGTSMLIGVPKFVRIHTFFLIIFTVLDYFFIIPI